MDAPDWVHEVNTNDLRERVRITLSHEQDRVTFPSWLQQVYAERFTGAVLVHFGEGVAHEIHVLNPETKIRLDKVTKRR